MHTFTPATLICIAAVSGFACRPHDNSDPPSKSVGAALPAERQSGALQQPANTSAPAPSAPFAVVGEPAPDFTLPDLDGKAVTLSSFKGKTVVLEWFNPECPFVRASHTKGSLVGTAERQQAAGVVWLAVNSAAPGKQGAGREKTSAGRNRFGMKHPILLDESGKVGRLYEAKTTPHMFVIAPDGKLVYRGAIDNSPDGEGESPQGGTLVNYVDQALAAVLAGNAVPVAETEPYGCSVKYGS